MSPSATSSSIPPRPPIAQDGGSLTRRLVQDATTLNPILQSNRSDRYVANYLFTPLVYLDRNLQPTPGIASSWTISEDRLTYVFELNTKATFSDGSPVRASDVVFTLRKIADPKTEAVQAHDAFTSLDIAATRAVDTDTVEVKFTQRLASQFIRFNDVLVLPESVYGRGDFRKDFAARAVGSGPYELVRRDIGKEVVLRRRANYWRERPHIETVTFKVIGDHATAFNALRTGDIDESIVTSDTWLRERSNPELTRSISFERFYASSYNYVAWNGQRPLLRDKRVRRALSMCIPVSAVIEKIFQGTARPITGPFLPDDPIYNRAVRPIPFDPPAARRELEALGWRDSNNDGTLDRLGDDLRLEILAMSGSAVTLQFAQLAQAELKKIGVRVDIAVMDSAAAIEKIMAGNYDAAYLSWDLDTDPDLYATFHSSQVPPHGRNFVFYSNPEVDRLIEEARREIDPSKRRAMYWRLHEILAADQPYTWLVQASAKWGVNKRVHGAEAVPGFGFFSWYPGELGWWVDSNP